MYYRFVRCEIENLNNEPQLVELGFGDYDLTLGATIVPAHGKRTLKAVVYRTDHPAYIDSVFPTMHGKPDGVLRGWMATTCDSVAYIKLLFPEVRGGDSVRIGRIWLEERYDSLPENELKEKFYPLVDVSGQYLFKEWQWKITSIYDFKTYDSLGDWNGLLQNTRVIPGAAEDMRDFMKEFTSQYFSKCRSAVKKVAPEMLYLGCRMDFHLYPEDTSLNYIIKIASEYCDVVSFNRGRCAPDRDHLKIQGTWSFNVQDQAGYKIML